MKKLSMPSAYTIAILIIVAAAILTWILPAGSYNYKVEGKDKIIPATKVAHYSGSADITPIAGTYQKITPNPQGIASVLQAPITGFYQSIKIILFVLAIGGFLGVTNKTGALDAGISHLIIKLKGKEKLLIITLTCLFAVGGMTFGMAEETFAFYPLLIPIMMLAGYDVFTSILIILLGSGLGCLGSVVTPFSVGIACGFLDISIGQGIVTRIVLLLVCLVIGLFMILSYASKVKKDPSKSILADKKEELEKFFLHRKANEEVPEFTAKRKGVLILFTLTFVLYIYAVIPFHTLGLTFMPALNWSFTQMSASFATSAVVIGLFYRMKENEIIENFLAGASDFLGVGIIIGIARGVSVILAHGLIIDTVLHYSDTLISHYSSYTCLNLIYVVHMILSFFITSSSGLATITMPIMGPLATFAHIPKDLVVTAYTAASGLVNLFGPTSAVVMGSIILGKVPYTRFLKYILPRCLIFIVATSLILSVSLYISLHF